MLGKYLTVVPPELIKPIFLEAIAYIWSHIDHFVDTVRNYAKQFFADIVMVAAHHKNNGNPVSILTNIYLIDYFW